MSTEIETKMKEHLATEFWGGDDRGVCLQISADDFSLRTTAEQQLQEEGYVQLTMSEAAALCNTLARFIKKEAKRRQALLKEEVEKSKIKERTVFHEVMELDDELMTGPEMVVESIDILCPKTKRKKEMR
jgi:hypothetical protein